MLPRFVFNLGAIPYDWMTANSAWRSHCADMARHFPAASGPRRVVLDLGCGPGVSALALARAHPGDAVTGLDISRQMMRRAVRRDRAGRCGWIQGSALDLPFRDGCADAATGHSFLYLLPDRRRALREIRRVLRPGGVLVLLEPTRQSVRDAVLSVGETLRAEGPQLAFTFAAWRVAARTSGAFDRRELRALLVAEGFGPVEVEPTLHGLGWRVTAHRSAE